MSKLLPPIQASSVSAARLCRPIAAALLLLVSVLLPAAPAAASAPAPFWELLGAEASPEQWTTIYEDAKPDRPLPAEEFARLLRVAHQPIASDRQLFRFDFSAPIDPEEQSLAFYLDADNDATTGRQDGDNAGAEEQVGLARHQGRDASDGFLYQPDGFRRRGNLAWIGVIDASVYAVVDVPVAQEDGQSRFGFGWLTQTKASDGRALASEKQARTVVASAPAPERPAPRPIALPSPSVGPEKPELLDRARLYTLPDEPEQPIVCGRLSWVGPVRVHHGPTRSLGRTTGFTLANHLHRVELPSEGGESSRFARIEALTPDWRRVESEVVELEHAQRDLAPVGDEDLGEH